ncbi:STN domain-containing protein [Luteimonas aquatica]|uniref:STN domain-containing protein n=1 Tax=Luteimonas aquatica TaxID=450364 RepID=UPI001F598B22|nr:STN domain-containing protein [Luteimonas aquatica]
MGRARRWQAACLSGCLSILAPQLHAQRTEPAPVRAFVVPAGDLQPALDLYIRQSGEQLIYRPGDLKGLKTHGVTGNHAPRHALGLLLQDTPLRATRDASGAVALVPAAGESQVAPRGPPSW